MQVMIDQIHSTWQLQQDALEDFRKLVCLMVMTIFLFLEKIIPKIFLFYTLYVSLYQTPIIKTNKY